MTRVLLRRGEEGQDLLRLHRPDGFLSVRLRDGVAPASARAAELERRIGEDHTVLDSAREHVGGRRADEPHGVLAEAASALVAPSPRYVRLLPSSLGVREGMTCSLTAGRRNRDERAK